MIRLTLLLTIVLCLLAAKSAANEQPQIQSLEVRVGFDRSAERFELTVPIVDLASNPVYWFLCIGGSGDYLDRLSGTGETNLVGSLACLLSPMILRLSEPHRVYQRLHLLRGRSDDLAMSRGTKLSLEFADDD